MAKDAKLTIVEVGETISNYKTNMLIQPHRPKIWCQ
jgi:hypothetical protein